MPNSRNQKPTQSKRVFKLTYWLMLTTLILFSLIILITGCGKRGSLNPLEPPEVFITSYEGVEDEDSISDPYYFQKRIYWRGESRGGVVKGYAYRVLNLDREPVVIPKKYIDADGWIYHYKPGADQSIPLTNPDVRTIWTTKIFDVINFPATVEGDSSNVVSIFEIKCLDNYEQESPVIGRYFNVNSHLPDIDIVFADRFYPLAAAADPENPIFKTVGLGFDAEFEFVENTPYTTNDANYFMYRIEKWDIATNTMISQNPPDNGFFETKNQRNVSRIWLALEDDDPADFVGRDDVWFVLTPDEFNDDNPNSPITETRMIIKSVNMANVQSPQKTAKFRVYENFRPRAIVYRRRTNVLGRNHFTTFQDPSINRPLPEIESPIPGEGTQYGTPFFINKDGNLAALWSNDIKIYLSWGWAGQFDNNDPDQGFINEVHDVNTGSDYLATVKAFDLRLDGAPYYYPPLENNPDYIHLDDDGTAWLRVPRYYPIDTRALLTDVAPGEHHFEVRVLDSQNRTSEPEDFQFIIMQRIASENKSGILIVDDETYAVSGPTALDQATNDFYNYIVSNYSGPVEVINRKLLKDTVWDPRLHNNRNVTSPTDFESYKLVIWHCDYPTDVGENSTTFHRDFDTVNLYMRGGGNMIISAGQNLRNILTESKAQPFYHFILEKYFGIPFYGDPAIFRMSESFQANPYFIGAYRDPNTTMNVPDLDLNLSFHPVVSVVGGLGPVAYFDFDLIWDPNVKPLYRMVTTPAGDAFAGKPVAIRRKTTENTTYLFGFPLSYMDQDQARSLMDVILDDLGI